MNFLHPWAIGMGAAAILLPVLIHFLTKPRPRSMPLSTIRFVKNAIQQRRARHWLRDGLLLALRGLAIGCLALAFAQPLFNTEAIPESDADHKVQRVVILDASQSMSAVEHGIDSFQTARVQASRYLKSAAGLRANLIVAAAHADAVFENPSANMKVVNDALAKATAKPEQIDINAALNAAAQMLASGNEQQTRELIIVSDFQRTNWAAVDFSPLPASTKIQLESTAPLQLPDNLAILSVGFSEKPTAGRPANLEIEIGNYCQTPRSVRVEVALGNQVFVMEQVCPPNVRSLVSHEIAVSEVGWQSGWARILENEDALPADDRYPFVVQAVDTPTCAIITRQSPSQRPSSSYFLERALSPWDNPVAGQLTVKRISPGRFSSDAVANSQLLVFDHPGRLPTSQIKSLASLIRRGRGVLYVASELVDATNLKMLYDELGSDLRAPVELLPPPRGVKRKSLTLDRVKQDRPPFQVFGDSLTAVLADLQISGGLATERVAAGLDGDVLATLSDQSVFLFSTPVGQGNFCVLNGDLESSNLPRHPMFVPLLNELVESLLRSNHRSQTTFCGQPLTRLLPSSVSSGDELTIVVDDQGQTESNSYASLGDFQPSGDGVVWNWRRPTGPQIFRVQQKQQTVYAIATHLPPAESDLRTLAVDVMTERLAGGRQIDFHRVANQQQEHDKSWIWLAVGAVGALIGEVVLLRSFRT